MCWSERSCIGAWSWCRTHLRMCTRARTPWRCINNDMSSRSTNGSPWTAQPLWGFSSNTYGASRTERGGCPGDDGRWQQEEGALCRARGCRRELGRKAVGGAGARASRRPELGRARSGWRRLRALRGRARARGSERGGARGTAAAATGGRRGERRPWTRGGGDGRRRAPWMAARPRRGREEQRARGGGELRREAAGPGAGGGRRRRKEPGGAGGGWPAAVTSGSAPSWPGGA